MNPIIKKILREQKVFKTHFQKLYGSRLKGVVYNVIDKIAEDEDDGIEYAFEDIISELQKKLALTYSDASFYLFSYLIEHIEDDPINSGRGLEDWLYKTDDEIDFLKTSGYYEKYIDYTEFTDVDVVEDKIIFSVPDWIDFSEWFDDTNVSVEVFSEDWSELFDLWGEDFETICGYLDETSIKHITDIIIKENKGKRISGLGHRDEFDHMLDDNDEILVDGHNIQNIKNIDDGYNLHVFIEEGDFEGKSELIREMRSLYGLSYNTAAEADIFKLLQSEITGFIGSEWKYGKDNEITFDVTNTLTTLCDLYITSANYNPLNEYGELIDMISNLLSDYSTKLSTPDMSYYYVDSDKISHYYNDMIQTDLV